MHEATFDPATGNVTPSSFSHKGSVVTLERISHGYWTQEEAEQLASIYSYSRHFFSRPYMQTELAVDPPQPYAQYVLSMTMTTVDSEPFEGTAWASVDADGSKVVIRLALPARWGPASFGRFWPSGYYSIQINEGLLHGLKNIFLGRMKPIGFVGRQFYGISEESQASPSYIGEIYTVNVDTGERTQLTDDGRFKTGGAVSQDYLAWAAGATRRYISGDVNIYVRDLRTGVQRIVTEDPFELWESWLDISGSRLMWAEYESVDHVSLHVHDLETGETRMRRRSAETHGEQPSSCTPPPIRIARIGNDFLEFERDTKNTTNSAEGSPETGLDVEIALPPLPLRHGYQLDMTMVWSESCRYAAVQIGRLCDVLRPNPGPIGTHLYDAETDTTRPLRGGGETKLTFFGDEALVMFDPGCFGMGLSTQMVFLE